MCRWWSNMRKTVCVDFDGVMNEYKGFDENTLYSPKPFLKEFLEKLDDEYDVVILTSRETEKVEAWLYQHGLENIPTAVTNVKVPAIAYIDDRAIQFKGNYNQTLKELENFKPYWQDKTREKHCDSTKNQLDAIVKYMEDEEYRFAVHAIDELQKELQRMKEKMVIEAYNTLFLRWDSKDEVCEVKQECPIDAERKYPTDDTELDW